MKKKEIVILAIVVVVLAAVLLLMNVIGGNGQRKLVITIDGQEYQTIALTEETNMHFTVETPDGVNEVVITNVITSYSIHYTKLYDNASVIIIAINVRYRVLFRFIDSPLRRCRRQSPESIYAADIRSCQTLCLLASCPRKPDCGSPVITSYSIHYTKLYESIEPIS